MLHYAVVFFVIALVAALFGFGGIAAGAAGIAKILFFVFLLLALVTAVRRVQESLNERLQSADPPAATATRAIVARDFDLAGVEGLAQVIDLH
jgi:uncharacterized membrane protein YtjA (UPF0391 family)